MMKKGRPRKGKSKNTDALKKKIISFRKKGLSYDEICSRIHYVVSPFTIRTVIYQWLERENNKHGRK